MSRQPRKKASNERHVEQLTRHLERRGPGDEWHAPTPERTQHARRAGQKITARIIETEGGLPTGHYAWRITPVIDSLLSRGTITEHEYDAALKYMRYYAGSRHKGPATAKLLPYADRGFQDMSPLDRAVACGQAKTIAAGAVHPHFHLCLRWLEKCAEDEIPLWQLGAAYYPRLSRSQQSAKASVILHFTLGMLCEHFGYRHRFTHDELENAVETLRITIEYEKKLKKSEKCA